MGTLVKVNKQCVNEFMNFCLDFDVYFREAKIRTTSKYYMFRISHAHLSPALLKHTFEVYT